MWNEYIQGFACAVAMLQRMDGSRELTAEVKQLLCEGGSDLASAEAARSAGVDEEDLRVLFPGALRAQKCRDCGQPNAGAHYCYPRRQPSPAAKKP